MRLGVSSQHSFFVSAPIVCPAPNARPSPRRNRFTHAIRKRRWKLAAALGLENVDVRQIDVFSGSEHESSAREFDTRGVAFTATKA